MTSKMCAVVQNPMDPPNRRVNIRDQDAWLESRRGLARVSLASAGDSEADMKCKDQFTVQATLSGWTNCEIPFRQC